jgi:hypothetical protein
VLLRAVVLALALSAVLPGRALAADIVTLAAEPNPVRYGGTLALSGTISPAVANETVGVYARSGGGLSRVASTTTDGLGTFSLALVARRLRADTSLVRARDLLAPAVGASVYVFA